jgi:hypothetical protein
MIDFLKFKEILFMNSIAKLSDSDLITTLKTMVLEEREKTMLVLELLKEVDKRRLYADSGYSSLFDYCVSELGYPASSAYRRITSMRLLREIPELKEDILNGRQNLSSLSQAQKFFKTEEKHSGEKLSAEEKSEVLEKLEGMSSRECERELLRMSSVPVEITNPEKERVLNDELTELKLVLDAELLEKLRRIQALRSHADPSLSYVELLKFMADDVLKRLDPIEKAKGKNPLPASEVKSPQFIRVAIPAKTKRFVRIRDKGICQYKNPRDGKRCGSRYFLELDHIRAVALGGGNGPDNLRLLCRSHNARAAVKVFGKV